MQAVKRIDASVYLDPASSQDLYISLGLTQWDDFSRVRPAKNRPKPRTFIAGEPVL
jgi:hypothetical protein